MIPEKPPEQYQATEDDYSVDRAGSHKEQKSLLFIESLHHEFSRKILNPNKVLKFCVFCVKHNCFNVQGTSKKKYQKSLI